MARHPSRGSEAESVDSPSETIDPRQGARVSDIVLTEVAKLQADGEHIKTFLAELRTDMRDIRDRMRALEVTVDHRPTKEFIITVVVVALGIAGAFVTIAPALQKWVGTHEPALVGAPTPPPKGQ
jgi:hypothetical protein